MHPNNNTQRNERKGYQEEGAIQGCPQCGASVAMSTGGRQEWGNDRTGGAGPGVVDSRGGS